MGRLVNSIYVENVVRYGKLADPEAAPQDDGVADSGELVETVWQKYNIREEL